MQEKTSENPGRRDFGKVVPRGALGTAVLASPDNKATADVHTVQPNIKLCAQAVSEQSDDDLLFLRQIGAEYVSVASTPEFCTAEGFRRIKSRFAHASVTFWNIGNTGVHNMPEVTFNLPGREGRLSNTSSTSEIWRLPESTTNIRRKAPLTTPRCKAPPQI